MDGLHELFNRWDALEQESLVVATLLSVQGHSYRKPGAVMLFGKNGPEAGSLSPGCLEADLGEHAYLVLKDGCPRTIAYDMNSPEDPEWGETAFCGGRITVLLEPLQGDLKEMLLQLKRWIGQGRKVVMNRIFDHKGRVQAYRLIRDGGFSRRFGIVSRSFWTWSARYSPKPRLLIFGAGKDARPVMELAGRTGFHVIAADWRESSGLEDRDIPGAAQCVTAPASAILEAVRVLPGDRVLLMSHQYRQDRLLLEQLVSSNARYIGILGSKTRIAKLLEGLVTEKDPRIHAPVGLSIGASGPEQIAVSIVGELIRDVRKERLEQDGGLLGGEDERRFETAWSRIP